MGVLIDASQALKEARVNVQTLRNCTGHKFVRLVFEGKEKCLMCGGTRTDYDNNRSFMPSSEPSSEYLSTASEHHPDGGEAG